MNRANSTPTRLTLLFYVAFAASFVQDAYTSPDFYRWAVGEPFQVGLRLLTYAAFLILTVGPFIRSLRARGFPWRHAGATIGALVAVEFVWRYGVNSLPGFGFKDVALVIDVSQPFVAALGIAAIIAERKARLPLNTPASRSA